ncbi:MAG: low temperature requirement protein A, partial [Cutibacterium avidum]|nr:low temperature requirement protein A [Cutibacterium avidum]
ETMVLWVPLYLLWANTSFSATGTITENKSLRRPILWVLFFGIFMAAGIPVAFEDGVECLAFVAPYLIAQLGQVAMTWFIHGREEMKLHSRGVMVWHCLSAIGWIIGIFVEPHARLWVWFAAVIVEVAGMLLRHPLGRRNNWPSAGWPSSGWASSAGTQEQHRHHRVAVRHRTHA